MKKALITGITGQDGSYLAELLLEKGCEVHGIIRRASTFNTSRIDHLYNNPGIRDKRLFLHYGDLTDSVQMVKLLYALQPDEIYNLAAQSHVRVSFDIPEYTGDVVGLGAQRILEAVRETGLIKKVRYYQASSSEMFGKVQTVPQTEATPFWPRSPYGCAKLYAHWLTVNYRESYNLHASSGILFNHESPRRGETFVTRKITRAATRIKAGLQDELILGNLDAQRDWGYAKEYVEMMWLMLQQDKPDDFVIGTNETHSVREFCEEAFGLLDLDWRHYVKHDTRYERPAEVDLLIGNPAKARKQLGWEPHARIPARRRFRRRLRIPDQARKSARPHQHRQRHRRSHPRAYRNRRGSSRLPRPHHLGHNQTRRHPAQAARHLQTGHPRLAREHPVARRYRKNRRHISQRKGSGEIAHVAATLLQWRLKSHQTAQAKKPTINSSVHGFIFFEPPVRVSGAG